jgi:hypothetical protein
MRRLLSLVAVLFALSFLAPIASAQEATPESAFAGLDLPTIDITVTADAYAGIPETLEAGRYLVNVTATDGVGEFGGGVGFIQPAGMTADEFIALTGEFAEAGGPDEAATPLDEAAAEAASPAAEEGGDQIPPFLFESAMAGGIYAMPGETSQIVLDLTPGEWVAWGDDPSAPWAPVVIDVTGEMPADLVEPESGATITMGEYVIQVTEGELVSGSQIIRVDNIGAQPHFVIGESATKPVTEADVEALLQAEMTGTPAAVDFDPDTDLEEAFYTGTQSTNTSIWVVADIPPGPLVMLCFFPDMADGMPHAFHGMYSVVEIPE